VGGQKGGPQRKHRKRLKISGGIAESRGDIKQICQRRNGQRGEDTTAEQQGREVRGKNYEGGQGLVQNQQGSRCIGRGHWGREGHWRDAVVERRKFNRTKASPRGGGKKSGGIILKIKAPQQDNH